jgi:hypothetical protein
MSMETHTMIRFDKWDNSYKAGLFVSEDIIKWKGKDGTIIDALNIMSGRFYLTWPRKLLKGMLIKNGKNHAWRQNNMNPTYKSKLHFRNVKLCKSFYVIANGDYCKETSPLEQGGNRNLKQLL